MRTNKKPSTKLEDMSVGYMKKDGSTTTIYVGNLSYQRNEKDIMYLFNKYGYVSFVRITRDKKTHKPKGIAFVQMSDKEGARKAIEALNGKQVDGRTLKVSEAIESNTHSRSRPQRKSRPEQRKRRRA